VKDAWGGNSLRFSFRRTVNQRLMSQWNELLQIGSSIQFTEESNSIIWKFNSTEKYSVQSLYDVVNRRCVEQIFTPLV
jgi:hypothetical protein